MLVIKNKNYLHLCYFLLEFELFLESWLSIFLELLLLFNLISKVLNFKYALNSVIIDKLGLGKFKYSIIFVI